MKILHICLAAFYIDNYAYQENILPKMHKLQGHSVEILASTETYNEQQKLSYINASSYINENGIKVTRLPYSKILPQFIMKKIRLYPQVYKNIESFSPDILFIHDLQFLSIRSIVKYCKNNSKVKVFIDGHTDFYNSARNWVSKYLLHGVLYKYCAKIVEPYTSKFYGVLPARCDFFIDMYKINPDKVDLLVMGFDDSEVNFSNEIEIKKFVRRTLGIESNDFIIVTGGKIDKNKNIHHLINAFNMLRKTNVHLVMFGSLDLEMTNFLKKNQTENIHFLGWKKSNEINDILLSSDLAIFPGTHSVLWEQSIGIGLPTIFKKWEGMQHLDLNGNSIFIELVSDISLFNEIVKILNDHELFNSMKHISRTVGRSYFSYSSIARKSIE